MNVLRMVKLFGWEEKMSQRIKETREKELLAIWWLKVSKHSHELAVINRHFYTLGSGITNGNCGVSTKLNHLLHTQVD